jgi:cytochrome P450
VPRPAQTFLIWRWPFQYLTRARERYGSAFTINITSQPPLVFLSDPAEIGEMLAAPTEVLCPGEGASTVQPLVGSESFMLQESETHLCGRRVVLPPLRMHAVQEYGGHLAALAEREVAGWPRGVPFAVHPRLRALTLQTILRTAFGAWELCEPRQLRALREALLAMLTVTASAVFPEPLLRHGPGLKTWRAFLRAQARADRLIYALIAGRRRSGERREDLLDRLLHARNADGSEPSSRQVRDNLMSIILAGHETTASQLAWAFQLLAHNTTVQERLAATLGTAAGEEYLAASVREVLRHRPVFLFAIPRAVKQAVEIGSFTYRPPAQLLACIYLLHHDPSLYPEPEEFRPERFLGAHPPEVWLPWGGGRKRCPGLHLATLELETVLRAALERFTVRPAGRIERARWRSVIVTPQAGSRVVLEPRSERKS